MKFEQFLKDLEAPGKSNENLELLYGIVVDNDKKLISWLAKSITQPDKIEDPERFGTLLVELRSESFLRPLVDAISEGDPVESDWLPDYMYALAELTDNEETILECDEEFIHLLGDWLQNTGNGEIAYHSATILSHLNHPACREYYILGVQNTEMIAQTRLACLAGLVNNYGLEEADLIRSLVSDKDPEFVDGVEEALAFIQVAQHHHGCSDPNCHEKHHHN